MKHYFRGLFLGITALLSFTAWAGAQEGTTVQGRVTTEAGAPLPAVSVFVVDLNVGSLTRDDGTYSFAIPAARVQGQEVTLTARLIGYTAQSARVTLRPGTITQDFAMVANPLRLGEVVVTGAGTLTTREKLPNVVNSVDSTLIQRSNESNIVQALAAKAPNVIVNQQSGEPGASSYMRIRGAKSISGTGQPLFVVDGVPIDNTTYATGPSTGSTVAPNAASDINPADIESVEILKGSAAAAIYGARAAEGVVLITTKSGRVGPTRYSLRTTMQFDEASQGVPLQRRYGQGSGGVAAVCGAPGCRLTSGSWGPELAPGTPTFDHFDALFTSGFMADAVLTASGGSDRTTFFFSAGRMDHDGIIVGPNNNYVRNTVRLKASHRLLDRLTIGGNVAYVDAEGDFVQKGSNVSGLMLGALRSPPEFDNSQYIDPVTKLHRSYRFPQPRSSDTRNHRGYDNPFFVANEAANQLEKGRVYGSINADYNPLNWLTVRWALGGDYSGDWRLEALPLTSSTYATGLLIRADIINYSIDHSLNAAASWTFTPNIAGTLTLGQNLNARRFRLNSTTGYDLIAPKPFALQNVTTWEPTETRSLIHTESYFAQAQVDLYDQLYLTAAIRNDGFSTFGASQRRHWFPKFGAAWTFTSLLGNESQQGILSFGKLRAAYGETGKEPGAYQTITALVAGGSFGGGWGDYLNASQGGLGGLFADNTLGNQSIKPERTKETELGIDLGLFDQRADLGVTYYDSKSEDVILSAPLPPSTGYGAILRNAARISNKGWEVSLNVRPITNANVAWEMGFQYAKNDGEVLDLLGAEFVDKSAGTFLGSYGSVTKGWPVGVIRGEDFVRCGRGLNIDGIDIDNASGHCQGAPAGALYIGADGFPVYDVTDRVIADPNPDWTGSVRTALTLFRRWTVTGLLDIKEGGDIWNGTRGALLFFGTHKDTELRGTTQVFGRNGFYEGTVAGPGAGQSVDIDQDWYQSNIGSGFTGPAAQFIEDGSYIKLREISVSYNLDQPFVRNLGFSSIDLRLAGRNLKTWTDYTGIDPETNLGGAEVFVQGIDYFNNPQTRSYVFSIGLNR